MHSATDGSTHARGREGSSEQAALYGRLRSLALRHLQRERIDHTLQPTALVHEMYVRLAATPDRSPLDHPELLQLASRVMRDVLVDHARRRNAAKRGANRRRETLAEAPAGRDPSRVDVLALDDALERLDAFDAEAALIVEMRFFGGLDESRIAAALGISTRTVRRGWKAARLWLARELSER